MILAKFKNIHDYMQKTKHNEDFWLMNVQDMNAMNLPYLLIRTIYDMMLQFLGNQIIFNPQHVHDIMNKNDHIYNIPSLNVETQLISMIWKMDIVCMGMTPLASMHLIQQKNAKRILVGCLWTFFSTWTNANDITSSSCI